MEYFVADSYEGFELVGTPYEKSGKMYSKARQNCDRCVKGVYACRVENNQIVPHPAYGGVCLKCGGVGYITKEIRLYTEKEKAAATRAKERAAERKVEERLANAEKKKAEWLKKECFTSDGVTTVYVGSNSFDVKDQLKEEGWKYSPLLGWHIAEADVEKYGAENLAEVSVNDLAAFNLYGEGCWLSTAKNFVDQIKNDRKPPSLSEWVGEVGERLYDISVTLVSVHGYNNQFGYSQVVKFETEDKSEIIWFTASDIQIKVGEKGMLTGTVKKHDIYKNNKITIVTRCKIS